MRLLIITQKVDTDDLVLGFFHNWIAEFAKKFRSVVVVCLFKGKFDLPDNVAVLSLGKEKWRSKLKYIFLLFYFSLRYVNRYDAVFVHMNEEYVVLAGWLWRLMDKKVFMWRNHYAGNTMTDIASIFCNKVFCTSKYSYTAKYKKTVIMPVGIDTETFWSNQSIKRTPRSILFLARIAPSKKIDIFVEAVGLLKQRGVNFSASIYGSALPKDAKYLESLKNRARELDLNGSLNFYSGITNDKTPAVYSAHEIFVNLSPDGMYDKTIFESMACGCLTLASNENLRGHVDDRLIITKREAQEVADRLNATLSLPEGEKRKIIAEEQSFTSSHSLNTLSEKLFSIISA